MESDDSENEFFNNNLWRLFCDFDGDKNWEHCSLTEDELAMCLAIVERENILSLEAQRNVVILDDADFTEAFEKIQIEYRKKVVTECYKNGKFGTENWRVEVRYL